MPNKFQIDCYILNQTPQQLHMLYKPCRQARNKLLTVAAFAVYIFARKVLLVGNLPASFFGSSVHGSLQRAKFFFLVCGNWKQSRFALVNALSGIYNFFAKLCHIHYQYYFANGHIEKMKYEIPLNTGTGMKKFSIEKCPSPKEELINPK